MLFRAGRPYHGRLAFDGEDHIDPKGRKLSTDGNGNFWYKRRGEQSHVAKFHKKYTVIQATTPDDAHHRAPVEEDAHANGLVFLPDGQAAFVTSHTDAYKGRGDDE